MKLNSKRNKTLLAAGSLAAAAAMLSLVPLNMGGCGSGGATGALSGITNTVTGTLTGRGGNAAAGSPSQGGGLTDTLSAVGVDSKTAGIVSGVTKLAQASMLPKTQENAMGQQVALYLSNEYGLLDDKALTRYVTMVGLTLADASPRPDGNYVFGVLDSDEVNAYSGPNGYIMISRGALKAMDDEAELAGVLAHEIAHVLNHDGYNAVKQSGTLSALTEIGMAATEADRKIGTMGVKLAEGAIDAVVNKPYSRDQEYVADKGAVYLLTQAGYNPNGFVKFLKKLEARQGGQADIMSTHPGAANRIERVQSEIDRLGARGGATLAARFKKNVKGL